jgi:hypothetical protein
MISQMLESVEEAKVIASLKALSHATMMTENAIVSKITDQLKSISITDKVDHETAAKVVMYALALGVKSGANLSDIISLIGDDT